VILNPLVVTVDISNRVRQGGLLTLVLNTVTGDPSHKVRGLLNVCWFSGREGGLFTLTLKPLVVTVDIRNRVRQGGLLTLVLITVIGVPSHKVRGLLTHVCWFNGREGGLFTLILNPLVVSVDLNIKGAMR
jgi:hypothetical protein